MSYFRECVSLGVDGNYDGVETGIRMERNTLATQPTILQCNQGSYEDRDRQNLRRLGRSSQLYYT